jgi:hypothetical protein
MEEELFKLNPTVQVTTPNSTVTHGLTKREYFAAMAMQGLLANGNYITNYKFLGEESVMFANALIEALNNTDNPNLQP